MPNPDKIGVLEGSMPDFYPDIWLDCLMPKSGRRYPTWDPCLIRALVSEGGGPAGLWSPSLVSFIDVIVEFLDD